MIQQLLQQVVEDNNSLIEEPSIPLSPEELGRGIPTLKANFYRPFTPMLKVRFEQFGAWHQATHANWLSLTEMEMLWSSSKDARTAGIKKSLKVISENWANDAVALFKPERISVFAGEDSSNERIYLLWFDFADEPEIWVYDSNGEAHYVNLEAYLQAFLDDNLSAFEKRWILG